MNKEQDGQIISYIDGFAWGITPEGGTVCLGEAKDIRDRVFKRKKGKLILSPTATQIIDLERELWFGKVKSLYKDGLKQIKSKEENAQRKESFSVAVKKNRIKHTKKGVCPVCREAIANSPHHIKPIKEGGTEAKSNKIKVCKPCHDILEAYADNGQFYSPQLAMLIRLGFSTT